MSITTSGVERVEREKRESREREGGERSERDNNAQLNGRGHDMSSGRIGMSPQGSSACKQ